MSVETQLQIRSLARDPSGQLASQAGALRRAENVVIRAPGVAESRPNFTLYREKLSTNLLIKALVEFTEEPLAVEYDTNLATWGLRRLQTDVKYTAAISYGTSVEPEPINYALCETRFAQARACLYITSKHGILRLKDVTNFSSGLDTAGVEMLMCSDWLTANQNYNDQAFSWAYAVCFVRFDLNDKTTPRRSPPSERWVVTSSKAVIPGLATRVYFSLRLKAGDQVELYRSRMATGDAPSPELFLTHVHTLSAADITLGYFTPPYDEGNDDQLGAPLYTNPSQGGALTAKYTPPRAQVLALYGSCMWYGRATSKARVSLTLRSTGLGGPVRGAVSAGISGGGLAATFTLGSPTVVIKTDGLVAGADFTDNITQGSTVAGTSVPALTTILSVDTALQITMSANALANGTRTAGMMSRYAPVGVVAGIQSGTHVLGSPIVTLVPSTANLKVGMGWSDSVNGPAAVGTLTAADTRILSIDSATQITLTKNALANGAGAAAYDCVEVATFPFYAWPGDTLLGAATPVWNWPLRCIPYWSAGYGLQSMASFITSLATAVNYFAVRSGSSFRVRAIPSGDTNLDDKEVTNWSKSIIFEETNGTGDGMVTFGTGVVFTTPFTVVCSRPTAFDPVESTYQATNDDKPNRLYWSSPDEPESVPLPNFADVGSEMFPILALAPVRDALLVFKRDGVFRVTGAAPSSWSIECIETDLRVMRPECVAVCAGVAYVWAERGLFEVDSSGARSLSAGALDVELRAAAQLIDASASCHGAWVVAWPERQLVLFGVPGVTNAVETVRIYAYSLVTRSFSEWPLAWGVVAEGLRDQVYYSRSVDGTIVDYEARSAVATPRGYDRVFDISAIVSFSSVTLVVATSATSTWVPRVGDMVSALGSTAAVRAYRRVTEVSTGGGNYTLTLESTISGTGTLSDWKAYEVAQAAVLMEWQPTSPARIPSGALCREIQVQLDLRAWPNDDKNVSLPEYIIGGTSERDTTPYTLTSNRARVAQVQPLRVGCSRQVARSASLAPYFKTGDIYPIRINGLSLVWEGTSERTRR